MTRMRTSSCGKTWRRRKGIKRQMPQAVEIYGCLDLEEREKQARLFRGRDAAAGHEKGDQRQRVQFPAALPPGHFCGNRL